MKEIKHSKQRELIRSYLYGNTSHPTADDVYQAVRQTQPDISLGTVYRNLNLLAENGEVRKLDVGDGKDRFDPYTDSHAHFLCTRCKKVYDVPYDSEKIREAVSWLPGRIRSAELFFHGECENCRAES